MQEKMWPSILLIFPQFLPSSERSGLPSSIGFASNLQSTTPMADRLEPKTQLIHIFDDELNGLFAFPAIPTKFENDPAEIASLTRPRFGVEINAVKDRTVWHR